jgi:hypothetical protein
MESRGNINGVLWGLIGLNALLAMLFVWQGGKPHIASAQFRHPPDYLMVPGEVSGGPTEIVYIVNTTDGSLGAVTYDDNSRTLQVMPAIDLNAVFDAGIAGKLH